MKKICLVCAAVVACVWAGSLSALSWPRSQSVETRTFSVSERPLVTLDDVSGDIEIAGWDRNTVELTATKSARDKADLGRIQVAVGSSADAVSVRVIYPDSCSSCDARLSLRVPRGTHLTAETSSGDVTAEGLGGPVRVQNSSGDITLTSIAGEMHLHDSSGDMTLDNCTGSIEAASSSGGIEAKHAAGNVDLVSTSGDVRADYARFDAVRAIRMESTSGDVHLTVPRGAGFWIQATTQSGSLDSNLRLPIHERDSGADVAAQVGDGKVTAQLRTTSGDISIAMR